MVKQSLSTGSISGYRKTIEPKFSLVWTVDYTTGWHRKSGTCHFHSFAITHNHMYWYVER